MSAMQQWVGKNRPPPFCRQVKSKPKAASCSTKAAKGVRKGMDDGGVQALSSLETGRTGRRNAAVLDGPDDG
jgi:hypothetical protein